MSNLIISRIRKVLSDKGETVYALSKKTGISQSTLSSALNRNSGPSTSIIRSILGVYPDVSPEWLMNGDGDMYKSDAPEPATVDAGVEALVVELRARTAEVDRLHAQIDRLLTIIERMQSGGQHVK